MTTRAQEYRYLAERVRDRAQTDTRFAAEWEQLARCYLLLAGEAEREEQIDIFDDPILPKPHYEKLRLAGNDFYTTLTTTAADTKFLAEKLQPRIPYEFFIKPATRRISFQSRRPSASGTEGGFHD